MSSNEFPDLNLLYTLALAEVKNTEIQQLKPDFLWNTFTVPWKTENRRI